MTEDNYIDYMARERVCDLIPTISDGARSGSQLLFLGYSLRDWNLRVILRQIWAEQAFRMRDGRSSAEPSEVDVKFWKRQEISILDAALEDWVDAMVDASGGSA